MRFRRGKAGAVPDTICALPWLNLSLDVDGSSRPCCKFAHLSADSAYQLSNLRDGGLETAWNGEAMQRLRRDFRAGKKPLECSSCWREEEAGIASFRQTYLDDRGIRSRPDYAEDTPDHPVALDLKLSNACNLKCRICGPVASSLWLREEHARGDLDPYVRDNRDYFRANKVTDHDEEMEVFRSWVPHLEHLEMTGGEPMLSSENREVIDLVVAEGRPERVTLLLTTNSMVIDERIMAHLPRFKKVTVSLSIDDVGDRLAYERAPAEWSVVEANIARYATMASRRVELYTNCSISALNVWYLPEYLDWLLGAYPRGEVRFNLNLVHGPAHYNVANLPPALKSSVRARLTDGCLRAARPAAVRRQVEGLLEFMGSGPGDPAAWSGFRSETARRDALRDQDFAATFPEYHAEIARLGLDADPVDAGAGAPSTPVRWPRRRRRIRS